MRSALWLVACAGCAAAPGAAPTARPPADVVAAAAEPSPALVLGEYGDYCVRVRGSAFCGDLRFDEPLAKGPPVGGFTDVMGLAMGQGERCVIRAGGTLHCSGDNQYGQLGAGLRDDRAKDWPAAIGLSGVTSAAVGSQAACAITGTGALYCWGRNDSGQTGSSISYAPGASELVRPARVPLPAAVRSVHPGYSSTCALLESGAVACFGLPLQEPLEPEPGPPDPKQRAPHVVTDLGTFAQLATTERGFCGVRQGGGVRCFGRVDFVSPDDRADLPGVPPMKRIASSSSHACAVAEDGGVWCFGRGSYGVLGRDLGDSYEPVEAARVHGVPPAVDVLVSGFLSCAVTRASEFWCWGGELQGGAPRSHPPTRMRLE